ncbi:YopT-type cysteine protease domain-containing protein [Cystobacter ferrugineus]|uniref:Peptidase C58 YopT-type domain-containing protein n=1 Tax=Cystobacter ferrugineus TaxID=83449 RepID=A0A1L9BIZ4_9BACT|nr:YopT-type cysteine protease domain-containing protein [Cystobacter ferrugineus]OJH42176.1 hypothetical protein BON30_02885 [Cystobacter ferrugineus]
MTIQKTRSAPMPRVLDSTPTSRPASPATSGAAAPAAAPRAETSKAPAAPPASYHQDQLGKARAPSQAPAGNPVFQSKQDIAVMNSRRNSVYGARAPKVSNRAESTSQTRVDCDQLAQKHGTACTTKIFQSDPGRLEGAAIQAFPGTSNGVCVAMSSEWIRANLQDAKEGTQAHSTLFHEMAENGGGRINSHFFNKQQQHLESNQHINPLVEEQKAAQQAVIKTYNDIQNPPKPSLWASMTGSAQPPPTMADLAPKNAAYHAAKKAADDAKQAELNRVVGNLSHGSVEPGSDFDKVHQDFAGQFPKQGFYQVSLFRKDGTGGHDIAVQMGNNPRLLDPNTGEWKFQSPAHMNAFMHDYMKTIYPSYAGGYVDSTHYPA